MIKKQLLDSQHTIFLNGFKNDFDIKIPKLTKSLIKLKKKIKKKNRDNNNIDCIEYNLDIIDNIKKKKNEIKNMKKKKMDYLLDNSKHIFDYFENKKNISVDNDDNNSNNTSTTSNINKNQLIKSFFKMSSPTDNNTNQILNDDKININDSINKYLCNINNTILDINEYVMHYDICKKCGKGELIIVEDEGVLMCNKCFIFVQYIFDNEKPSYKDPPKEVCFYAYKRINHFKEILSQFQGKETTQIPKYIIENIRTQIKKERIELLEITNMETKSIIKKLGYNKYYEHIPFIKEQLGIKPPVMSQILEETLCNLFMDIQVPYSKFCPDNRVNFLNYYYTAYKLCELLGETTYLPHFQMLKDRDKRIEQDGIWKQICGDLNWKYIPTI
jgi:hypothetical protein